MFQKTFAMIKPDAVAAGNSENIMERIELSGFVIIQKKKLHISKETAFEFYVEHEHRAFFNPLIEFMSSGPIYVLVLAGNDAIINWRNLMGPTDSNVGINCIYILLK
jgi:nucleoside diphosphate kinase